jgi:type VI secretion system secreted protein Hcp
MAYEFYVSVEATKQGKFKGESVRDQWKEKIPGLALNWEIKSPRDIASGQASGKRQHYPVTFVKEWGASSPQFMQAVCTNEVLKKVLFEFIRTNANGEEQIHHTIELTNATVSNLKAFISMTKHEERSDVHELEEISLTYQKVHMENTLGKTSAIDDWHK